MPGTEPGRIAGIVLAAGASSRMGRNKMLLELDGETLVRRAARMALSAGLAPVVVVVGFEADLVKRELEGLDCQTATNEDYAGPSSRSFHVGLRALAPEVEAAVAILPDMVRVSEAMVRSLVATSRESPAPLLVSRYGNVTAPPTLFRRSLFAELLGWEGEGCGKPIVRAHAHEASYLVWPQSALDDVDTPEDFARVGGATVRGL